MNPRVEKARELIASRSFGILATMSKRMPGFPFASVTPYACDENGTPLFLMSGLAVHSKNLAENPKASLLVYEPEAESDPLSSARMNLMGEVHVVPEEQAASARAAYLARHPESEQWIDFGDFALYRLAVVDVYYIGGFGEMGWVAAADYSGR